MEAVLLDTTVASMLHPSKKDDPLRNKYSTHMKGKILALSFQSVAELWEWAESNSWGVEKRASLETLIHRFLVIPFDFELAQVWARVMSASRKEGRRFEAGDCWIASTAVQWQIPLLTHDHDFIGRSISNLEVISYISNDR